jgi:hypothetical protein
MITITAPQENAAVNATFTVSGTVGGERENWTVSGVLQGPGGPKAADSVDQPSLGNPNFKVYFTAPGIGLYTATISAKYAGQVDKSGSVDVNVQVNVQPPPH